MIYKVTEDPIGVLANEHQNIITELYIEPEIGMNLVAGGFRYRVDYVNSEVGIAAVTKVQIQLDQEKERTNEYSTTV